MALDLPGFGRSGKGRAVDATMEGYDAFLERFLAHLGLQRVRMLVHDWGAVGLLLAQRRPELIERLVVVNAVPLLGGYRWHRTAKGWRTPLLGELSMATTNALTLALLTIESNARPGPMPLSWRRSVLSHLDLGTRRAILRLYRSSPEHKLARSGERLRELDVPALVVWGMRDPYIPSRFARAYAEALPRAELLELEDAGHWPWIDRPDLLDTLERFLTAA